MLAVIWLVFPKVLWFEGFFSLIVTALILTITTKLVDLLNDILVVATSITLIIVITWPIQLMACIFADSISLYLINTFYDGVVVNAGFFTYMLMGIVLGLFGEPK